MIYKKALTLLLLSFIAIFSLACSDTSTQTEASAESKIVMKTLDVKGMTCEGCEATIVSHVTKVDGVISSKASHVKESVIVKYDTSITDIDTIMQTISKIGYKVNGLKKEDTDK